MTKDILRREWLWFCLGYIRLSFGIAGCDVSAVSSSLNSTESWGLADYVIGCGIKYVIGYFVPRQLHACAKSLSMSACPNGYGCVIGQLYDQLCNQPCHCLCDWPCDWLCYWPCDWLACPLEYWTRCCTFHLCTNRRSTYCIYDCLRLTMSFCLITPNSVSFLFFSQ